MDFEVRTGPDIGRVKDSITVVRRVLESGKPRGAGLTICHGVHETPLGTLLVGRMDQFLCWLGIVTGEDKPVEILAGDWPGAMLVPDQKGTAPMAKAVVEFWQNRGGKFDFPLLLVGTEFQLSVWETLLKIPSGTCATYQNVAEAIGSPAAVRAVGSAVGANPVSLLIPCHRVVRKGGDIINYRWGADIKTRLLDAEAKAA